MPPQTIAKWIAGAVALLLLVIAGSSATYVVEPGHRGVMITLGRVSPTFKPEGFGMRLPFISRVSQQLIRQQTVKMQAECYSSDLQEILIDLRVLYRVPQASVVRLYRDFEGDPFEALIKPRLAEAVKEVTALQTAEEIVQKREAVKSQAFDIARRKVGEILVIEDVVLEDIRLTPALESAIEAKMVQEQEAARALFAQQQATIDAETAVIKARGEAESINLRGRALRENPSILDLQVVEQWDGFTPLVVGPESTGADMILPLGQPQPRSEPPSEP